MFTGIVQAIGQLKSRQQKSGDQQLGIATGGLDRSDLQLGDSVCTNGVCLTVVELTGDGFIADVSRETLALSTLGQLPLGAPLNLEKALTLATPLGGHLVSGHVDGVARVVSRRDDARSVRFVLEAPAGLARYIAHKGSVCIDGTSLTVNRVDGAEFELNIVPHTLQQTIMADYREGTEVNLEVDLLARYLERLLQGDKAAEPKIGGIDMAMLARAGFLGR